MKFGTYFAYWEREWDADYFKYIEKVSKLGFDVLEVSGAGILEMDDDQLAKLKKAASDAGIMMTGCYGVPKSMDVSSVNEETRSKGLETLKKMIVKLNKAGIDRLGGIMYAYWPVDYSEPVEKDKVRAISIESVRELADFAKPYGITLELEVVNRFEQFMFNDAAEAVQFCKDVDRENVKVMLDCFHMNIEEDNLGDAIRNTGSYLGHFHIGECNRKVPGKGHMPWAEMGQALRDIGYDGCVVMEPFTKMGGTVGSEIKVWRDLSDNADEAKMDADIKEALEFVKKEFNG